jgi:hypothetical protein
MPTSALAEIVKQGRTHRGFSRGHHQGEEGLGSKESRSRTEAQEGFCEAKACRTKDCCQGWQVSRQVVVSTVGEGVVLLAPASRHRDPRLTAQPPHGVFGPSPRLAGGR